MPRSHLTILRRDLSRSYRRCDSLGIAFGLVPYVSDAFSATQQRFAHRIKDGRVCHTLLPTLNKFEKASNSPTQRSELKTNSYILNLFWNRIPNISHVPMSLKETVTVKQSLAADLESHNFLT